MKCLKHTSAHLSFRPPELQSEVAISTSTVTELPFDVFITTDAVDRSERQSAVRPTSTPRPIDCTVAPGYGRLAPAVAAAGRQTRARVMEPLIAVTAEANRAGPVTVNAKDLIVLEGLVEIVELW